MQAESGREQVGHPSCTRQHLANASKELEEAAVMDGANLLQQIWYVELPAIKDIIVIQFILQAGNIMSIGFAKSICITDGYEPSGI